MCFDAIMERNTQLIFPLILKHTNHRVLFHAKLEVVIVVECLKHQKVINEKAK